MPGKTPVHPCTTLAIGPLLGLLLVACGSEPSTGPSQDGPLQLGEFEVVVTGAVNHSYRTRSAGVTIERVLNTDSGFVTRIVMRRSEPRDPFDGGNFCRDGGLPTVGTVAIIGSTQCLYDPRFRGNFRVQLPGGQNLFCPAQIPDPGFEGRVEIQTSTATELAGQVTVSGDCTVAPIDTTIGETVNATIRARFRALVDDRTSP